MELSLSTWVSFLALLYYSVLLVIILRQRPYSRVQVLFSLYLLSMIIWSFASFMIFAGMHNPSTLFWNRFLVVGSMAMPVAFYGFVMTFLGKYSRTWVRISILSYIVMQVLNLTGLVVTQANLVNNNLVNEYGPGLPIVSTFWIFFLGSSTYELIREYRRSKDLTYRNRLRYLLLVIIVIFSGNLTNLSDLQSLPTDVAANILSAMLITFAILRHHLLDISTFVRKGALYSIPTVLIGASYYLAIQSVLMLFPNIKGIDLFFFSITAAILTALVFQPFLSRMQVWIDRMFFREKYDASLMLERISRNAAHLLDLESITKLILSEVIQTLHIHRGAILIKRQEGGYFALANQIGFEEIANLIWEFSHPVVEFLEPRDKPLTRFDLEALLITKTLTVEIRSELDQVGAELFIPLKVKDEMVGIFILGNKLSGLTFSEDDQLTLTTLANQTAVAIENARLFSAEQNRREELDALYELTRQLVATNEVNAVIQNTTHHVVTSAHVTFSRILTPDERGGFYCRAAYPIRSIHYNLGVERFEPQVALPFYDYALKQSGPVFVNRTDPGITDEISKALMLDLANTLCMCPLKVSGEELGLLVLGERREANREPFDPDKMRMISAIADQAANALQRANMHEQMENTFLETVLALANAMDARDSYTSNHSHRLSTMAEILCREVNGSEEEVWAVHWAGMLHDIGKIGVPDQILKKNGPLSSEDWVTMRQHPDIGARIVEPVKKLGNVAPLIRAHHEWYNGSGYPQKLKGKEIPLGARILTIADAFTAMTDERIYHKPLTEEEAIKELRNNKETQFDPELVEVFISLLERGMFPKQSELESIFHIRKEK